MAILLKSTIAISMKVQGSRRLIYNDKKRLVSKARRPHPNSKCLMRVEIWLTEIVSTYFATFGYGFERRDNDAEVTL